MAEMTLQEAFDAHIVGKDKSLVNNFKGTLRDLEKAGFPPDTLVSQLNTEDSIKTLQKWATTERFKEISSGSGMFASRVKTLINAGIGPEQTNVLSNYEKANRGKPTEFGIRLTRVARKLELPAFDDFNEAIDATARQLTDKEAKAFFMIKTLTGLRNPDILNLQVGNAEEGAKYGSFDPEVKKLYNLSNKGDRINYDLGEIVHGILADLAADAQAAGRTQLFTQSEDKIRSTINPIMRSNMKSMGLEIRDLSKNKAVDFSVRDLRKNIFDILEEEIGAADANKVLGHSEKADVGLNHYKVERKSRKSLSRLQNAQEIFSNLYMESLGFDNPQLMFGAKGYGFSDSNFNATTAIGSTVAAPTEQQAVQTEVRTAAAQTTAAVDRSVESLENKIKKLEGLTSQVRDLTAQTEELVQPVDTATQRKEAARDRGKAHRNALREMLNPRNLKSSALAGLATAGTMLSKAPGPAFDLVGGLVDKESYDIAEQKGRTFVSELTGQPEDSFLSRMGGGAGVVGEMLTGAVADPEGAARTSAQMMSLLGKTPILDLTGGIPDAAPPQTGTLEAEDAASNVQDVENRARSGQPTSLLDVQPQTL